jgi:hypothetical protein
MGDRRRTTERFHQRPRDRLQQPPQRGIEAATIREGRRETGDRFRDCAGSGREQLLRHLSNGTAPTCLLEMLFTRRPAGPAEVVACDARTGPADLNAGA